MLTTFDKISIRSNAFSQAREFFSSRGYLEVDVPICNPAASVDPFIDLFYVEDEGYLHSSPELKMKELLCNGSKNIYFLGHVFRKEEEGSMHSKEFTMLEYYKAHTSEKAFLQETIDFLSFFLGQKTVEIISFDEAMEKFTPKNIAQDISHFSKKEQRHFLFSHYVEKNLGKNCFTIINDFPAEEASLAVCEQKNGKLVAKRFEIFVDGVELANGFYELCDPEANQKRFIQANKERSTLGKKPYPIDRKFLNSLKKGLPSNTYGIAIGFDRLLMIKYNIESISKIIL